MNQITLTGHVGKDPEEKTFGSNTVVNFSIAVKGNTKNKETNEYESDWWNCVCWDEKRRKVIMQYVKKGGKVLVSGPVNQEKYVDKNGNNATAYKVNVQMIELLGGKESSASETSYSQEKPKEEEPIKTDDLPF